MIRIRNIRVRGEDFNIMAVQYPDDMRFDSEDTINHYREYLIKKWTDIFGHPVKIDIDYIDIPRGIEVKRICELTAKELGLTIDGLFSKNRNPELVQGRMIATQICLDSFISPTQIEENTPWVNRIYSYYRNKLQEQRDIYPDVDELYKNTFDNVMTILKNENSRN